MCAVLNELLHLLDGVMHTSEVEQRVRDALYAMDTVLPIAAKRDEHAEAVESLLLIRDRLIEWLR